MINYLMSITKPNLMTDLGVPVTFKYFDDFGDVMAAIEASHDEYKSSDNNKNWSWEVIVNGEEGSYAGKIK